MAAKVRLAAPTALALVVCVTALSVPGSGAAASTSTPRCAAEGYGLAEHGVRRTSHRQETLSLTVGWLTAAEGHRSCALRKTIRLTIADSHGVTARAHWIVSTVLHPWSAAVHTWVWRNWCTPYRRGEVKVTYSVRGGRSVRQRISTPPACVRRNAPTTVADLGTGTKYVKRPGDPIAPHILPPGTPPPLPYTLVAVTNAWLVSDGYSLVAVYAGARGNEPALGRFAIIRQNLIFGVQYAPPVVIDVPGAGALKITSAPTGAANETSAQRGKLTFTSAHGVEGVLDLSRDRVRVTTSP